MTAKRRRFLSFLKNEPAQRYYVGMHFLMLFVLMVVLIWAAYQLFQHYIVAVGSIELSRPAFEYHLKDLFQDLSGEIVIIFGVGFVVTVLVGLSFLHRVTGPMVRVRNVINELAGGKIRDSMVQFRRGDFSKEMEQALSRLIEYLNRMHSDPLHKN